MDADRRGGRPLRIIRMKTTTVNSGHVERGVFINGEPTQPGMLQMLWVLPELAPIKASEHSWSYQHRAQKRRLRRHSLNISSRIR